MWPFPKKKVEEVKSVEPVEPEQKPFKPKYKISSRHTNTNIGYTEVTVILSDNRKIKTKIYGEKVYDQLTDTGWNHIHRRVRLEDGRYSGKTFYEPVREPTVTPLSINNSQLKAQHFLHNLNQQLAVSFVDDPKNARRSLVGIPKEALVGKTFDYVEPIFEYYLELIEPF